MPESIRLPALSSFVFAVAVAASGCSAQFVRPGRPADLALLTQDEESRNAASDERSVSDLSLREILERRPTAAFPTAIAVVRLQGPEREDFQSPWNRDAPARSLRFEVVTRRDVETDACMERLRGLPEVSGIAGVNALLLPERIQGELDLRKIAASVGADVLLIYTLDTHEELDDESPLISLLTLGILPTHEIEVRTTASAVLLDTRTGYCYGVAEGTAYQDPHTSFWTWEERTEDTRVATEREAFAKMVDGLAGTWQQVVAVYGPGAAPAEVLPTQ